MEKFMSEDISKLAFALAKFQGTIGNIPKTKQVNVGKYSYKYADLADIWEIIRKPLADHELAISQVFVPSGDKSYIQTMLLHTSGQWIQSRLEMSHHEKVQELGSEITYLRRYGLSSALGLVADEDDDGKLANEAEKPKETPKATISPIVDWKPAKAVEKTKETPFVTLEHLVLEKVGTAMGLVDFVRLKSLESQNTKNPGDFDKVVEAALSREELTAKFCDLYRQWMRIPDKAIDE